MVIIIDLILIAIIAISALLGYKKGLVELGAKLFAGIIAIIVTLIIYKPISNIVINNTNVDESIAEKIISKTSDIVDDSNIEYIKTKTNVMLKESAKDISINIVYIVTGLVLFVVIKIILSIVIKLADVVASLPILKQFNEVGGLIYGVIRGALIVCIIVLIMGINISVNPNSNLNKEIKNTYLTKLIYENIVKF